MTTRHHLDRSRRRTFGAGLAVASIAALLVSGCTAASSDAAGASEAAQGAGAAASDAASELSEAAGTPGKDEKLQEQLDALVEAGYPGVVASVTGKDGKTVHYTAGVSDLKTKAPMMADPHIRIASNTKTFTATVVLQLVGEGKIDLDAPIETYLPGLVRGQGIDGREITVRNLLQQTSGLPGYNSLIPDLDLAKIGHTYFEPRRLLDGALSESAQFAPGTSWGYSNTNYVLAGLIVERVTGRPIGEEITHRIIDRIGLEETSWPSTGDQTIPSPHPTAYLTSDAAGKPITPIDTTEIDPSLGWAAGQLISTPSDVGIFFRALLDGKLLEPAQQEELETVVPAETFEPEPGWSYGLGFATKKLSCGVDGWGHGGDIQGFESRELVTRDGRSAVIASNALPVGAEPLMKLNTAVETAICDAA